MIGRKKTAVYADWDSVEVLKIKHTGYFKFKREKSFTAAYNRIVAFITHYNEKLCTDIDSDSEGDDEWKSRRPIQEDMTSSHIARIETQTHVLHIYEHNTMIRARIDWRTAPTPNLNDNHYKNTLTPLRFSRIRHV